MPRTRGGVASTRITALASAVPPTLPMPTMWRVKRPAGKTIGVVAVTASRPPSTSVHDVVFSPCERMHIS
eukprot:1359208-Prymnesium_polylepis.1